jgi:hypothetical protein
VRVTAAQKKTKRGMGSPRRQRIAMGGGERKATAGVPPARAGNQEPTEAGAGNKGGTAEGEPGEEGRTSWGGAPGRPAGRA